MSAAAAHGHIGLQRPRRCRILYVCDYVRDAAHAFANERSAAYNVACANQAWERMSAFLKATIA